MLGLHIVIPLNVTTKLCSVEGTCRIKFWFWCEISYTSHCVLVLLNF